MSNTRLTALAVIAALAVSVAVFFGFGLNNPDPATARATLLRNGKQACFKDARADSRNVLLPDAKLTTFCGCVVDRSVGERMPINLQAANSACRGALLD